ncbi:Tfp pilus assembly protein FimT/FimU [Campylobacterota bacterium]
MRKAFTFIEMVFVIVVLGILAKFGAEIFRNVYQNYTLSVTNNKLQTDSEIAIQQISNRLQYRIKNSVIGRDSTGGVGDFKGLSAASGSENYNILEWVGYDVDGWLGDDTNTTPTWSGFIDVDDLVNSNVNTLVSPASDFRSGGRVDTVIQALSPSTTTVADAAIIFTGSNSNVKTDYGWDTTYAYDQNDTAVQRISAASSLNQISPTAGDNFSGVDVYEQYKMSWTAYALELNNRTLRLYFDYQPWRGERHTDGNSSIIMEDVTTFKFQVIGDILKVQICVGDKNILNDVNGEYAICKEKAIF